MYADFARFDITPSDYAGFLRFIERTALRLSNDPDVQADLSQEMWLKCLTILDDPPDGLPDDRQPRNKYLATSMARVADRFKPFDAPLAQNHKPQDVRMSEYIEE